METLEARLLLCFYDNITYLYFTYENTVNLTEIKNLSEFTTFSNNELLLSIILNSDKIIKELCNIENFIKNTYSKTSNNIKFSEKKLINISPLFRGISNYAYQYARSKKIVDLESIPINESSMFYDAYIHYLQKCCSHIKLILELVDSYFNFNKCFDVDSSPQKRLITHYYTKFLNNGLTLPESTYLLGIKTEPEISESNKKTSLVDYDIALLNQAYDKFYTDINFDFNKELIDENIVFINQYKCKDFIEILNILFYQMVISKSVINKCHNCNKYFIPSSKSNEKYCNNIYKTTNKTCKEYAAKAKYREEIKSEPIKKVHYTISQKYRMRISRSKVESIINKNKIEFQKYKDEYKKRKKDYKDGKLSEADFLKWLNEKKEVE